MPDMATQGTVLMDGNLRVLSADSLFYASFNISPEEAEGHFIQDLGNGQWGDAALRQLLQNAITHDRSFTGYELTHEFPNGVGRKCLLLRGGRIASTSHPEAVVLLSCADNTARHTADEALRHSEERYRRLFQNAKDGILILDAYTGHIVEVNAYIESLVGLESQELLGKELYEIGLFKDIIANKAAFHQLQRDRYIRYEQLPVRNQRGETVPVEFIANVYREGPRMVAQCNVRDISEKVALETELARKTAALADETRRKDEFLAMLSHELRNPMAPIRSALHLLQLHETAELGPIQREAMDVIDRQVINLTKLVNDLLGVSRVLNGRVHLDMQTVDIQEVVRHAVETVRPKIDRQQHTLVLQASETPIWVRADALRMEEVFINLLTNAVKYTPDGGHIEVAFHIDKEDVLIAVSDNGIGLQDDVELHLFEMFGQADRSLDRAQGGLGVGLSLARSLVDLHGGSLHASSDGLGTGSTFTVCLPLIDAPHADLEAPKPTNADAATAGSRVLVVDDNMDLTTMLTSILRRKGYDAKSAYTGPDGLQIAEQWVPDIVLMDINLPGLNGYEIARRLRANAATAKMRLIALTGFGQESDIALTREAGFDVHIMKPYNFEELEKRMHA